MSVGVPPVSVGVPPTAPAPSVGGGVGGPHWCVYCMWCSTDELPLLFDFCLRWYS